MILVFIFEPPPQSFAPLLDLPEFRLYVAPDVLTFVG